MKKIWKVLLLILLIPVLVWAAADPSAFIYAPKGWQIQNSCTGIEDNGSGCWDGSSLCIGNGSTCASVGGGITPGSNATLGDVGANKLTVTTSANLPANTMVGGNVLTTDNFKSAYPGIDCKSAGGNVIKCPGIVDDGRNVTVTEQFIAANVDINGGTVDGTVIGGNTPAAVTTNNLTATGGNVSLTNITVNDFLYMSVDAGIDTPYAPSATTMIRGNVTAITAGNVTAANGTYTTFTPVAGGNITAAASAAGANATLTFSNMTVGRVVHHQFTPTLTSGSVPTLTVTSGATLSSLCTFANATICDSYFIPTSANVVLTITTADAANFVIGSSSTYEYSRAAIGRDFSHTTAQALLYDIYFPYDWDAGNVYAKLFNVIDQSSAPAANNTVIYQIGGFCVGTNDSLDQTMGTGVNATFTAGANMAQYQEVITNESGAITLNNAGAGKKCRTEVRRLTTDTYTQPIALTGMRIRFSRVMNGTYRGN